MNIFKEERERYDKLTDLELCRTYVEKTRNFVNPVLLGAVNSRGLIHMVNYLPKNKNEALAVLYSRFVYAGKSFGDPEIDHIAGLIEKTERLQKELVDLSITEVETRIPILSDLLSTSEKIKNYFKNKK